MWTTPEGGECVFEGAEAALWTALARQGFARMDQTGVRVVQTGWRHLDVSSIRPTRVTVLHDAVTGTTNLARVWNVQK